MNILIIILGALWRRWWGGWIDSPRWLKFPLAIIIGMLATISLPFWLSSILSLILALCWTPGHGSYMDMSTGLKEDNEWVRYIFQWAFKPESIGSLLYDFVGMSVRYLIFTIPIGCILALYNLNGLFYMPLGIIVALIYCISFLAYRKLHVNPIKLAEFCTGGLLYGVLSFLSN